jgi:FkbM family methyltransferase
MISHSHTGKLINLPEAGQMRIFYSYSQGIPLAKFMLLRAFGLQVIKLISLIRYYKLGRGLKIFLDFLFAGGKTTIIRSPVFANDISLRKDQSDPYIFDQVFTEQQYDFPHPDPSSVKVIIDAGANIGLAAIYFSQKFPNARIYSIEPDISNFQLLVKNTAGYPNVTHIHGALWHTEEKLKIFNTDEKSAGYMMKPADELNDGYVQAHTVTGLMLQYQLPVIDILKIDIEGSEKEVFAHNSDLWLTNTHCVITELHDNLKPGTSKVFFTAMGRFNWNTIIKGENIICVKEDLI